MPDTCLGCGGQLESVATDPMLRPHVRCSACKQVYVPHENCRSKNYRGLHPCDDPTGHLVALRRIEAREKAVGA